jgi:hypothetical protein
MSKQVENFVNAAIETAAVENKVGFIRTDRNYQAVASAVIDTVAEQGDKIADAIRGKGQEIGLSESDVENFLIEVGLADEPEVEAEPVTLESLAAAQAKSDALLQELLAVAKRYAPQQFGHIG